METNKTEEKDMKKFNVYFKSVVDRLLSRNDFKLVEFAGHVNIKELDDFEAEFIKVISSTQKCSRNHNKVI